MSPRSEALAAGRSTFKASRPCKRGHLGERWTCDYSCVECTKLRLARDTYDDPARDAAKMAGSKTYQPASPCVKGHLGPRVVKSGSCVECNRAACNSSAKLSRQKNRDREKARRVGREEEFKAKCREWHRKNRPAVKAYKARKYRENPERFKVVANERRWRAKKATRILSADLHEELRQIYKACPEGHEVDHIVPLKGKTVCGLHVPWNLQYLTVLANRRKHNSFDPVLGIALHTVKWFQATSSRGLSDS